MRPSTRPTALTAVATALCALVAAASPAAAQEASDSGYTQSYTIHADAAWLPGGRVVSPAYVSLDKGRIVSISTREPGEQRGLFGSTKPRILKVSGTLAPTVVDAWSGLAMAGRDGGRRPLPQSRMMDDLPLALEGINPALSARVDSLRESGVGAVYLGRLDGALQRGMGVVATFSAGDVPMAANDVEWLDLNGVAGGAGAQLRAEELRGLFDAAIALRDSREDHTEALEKYEESLKKYEEDFAKYLEEKGKGDKKGDSGKAKAEGKGDKKEDDKRPKRPNRPAPPKRNVAADLVLDAMNGNYPVRLQADDPGVIAEAIKLAKEHKLKMLLVGGKGAAGHADQLADLGIGVVLDLSRQLQPESGLAADFKELREAGVDVALGSGGRDLGPMLLVLAGELVAEGADSEAIWDALTRVPARLLGLEGQAGQLSRGAIGSMVLFGGSTPFDASGVFRSHQPK